MYVENVKKPDRNRRREQVHSFGQKSVGRAGEKGRRRFGVEKEERKKSI